MNGHGPAAIAVTGATGWIGRALLAELDARGLPRSAVDRAALHGRAPWPAQAGCTAVHLAAIAHRDARAVSAEEYDRVNRGLALVAAARARDAGARRFVFVSTAAVMGPRSARPLVESDPPAPSDEYARAKLAAERELVAKLAGSGLSLVVVRPPLVYGPGVQANFLALLNLATRRIPLPLGAARAQRSAIYIDNLVDALVHAATSPAIDGGTYFVRDDTERSVSEWVAAIRAVRGMPPRLLDVPPAAMAVAARAIRREGISDRLFSALQIDDRAFRRTGWQPPVDPMTALRRTVAWHEAHGRRGRNGSIARAGRRGRS